MKTAFATPLIVRPDRGSMPLERVPLSRTESADTYSEDWLQDLLYRHPRALPIGEIDESFQGLVPVCREMQTSAGKVDVVYVTPTGRPVIVEAKLWRNPEARRKVIGQVPCNFTSDEDSNLAPDYDQLLYNGAALLKSKEPEGLDVLLYITPNELRRALEG
jgi:hypothetical protein